MKNRATVICAQDGNILLVRKDKRKWALPGGKVEPGESPAEAAARELSEETGLDVQELLYLLQFSSGNVVHHVFEASVRNPQDARPQNEIAAIQWRPYAVASEVDAKPATRTIISSFLRRL
jgi:8-oxo-dGTP diphosphatase